MKHLAKLGRQFLTQDEGAVVTEYGMLIVVVVIGMAIVLVAFRSRISNWFDNIATNLNSLS